MDELTQPEIFYIPAVKKMRFLLMIFAIIYTYGLQANLTELTGALFSFSFPALYIISGFLVLRQSQDLEKRLLRTIGRTALCFIILFIVYLSLSLIVAEKSTLAMIATKRFWLDFLLLNICALPIGTTIWFVQALLYAYIFIYVIYKLKLLRLDIYIAAVCLVIAVLSGELSSLIGFRFLGHTFIGGNFLTRALPYILIGCFIYRKREFFGNLDFVHHICIFAFGALLAFGEYYLLGIIGKRAYVGHLLGMGIVAVALCLFTFFVIGMELDSDDLRLHSRFELSIPYYISSPIYTLCMILFEKVEGLRYYFGGIKGLVTLVLSVASLYAYFYARSFIIGMIVQAKERKSNKLTGSDGQ